MAYAKHTWQTGETITATKLNNIENGIATNDEAVSAVAESVTEVEGTLESKANVDGVYETMTVGNAEQLVSTQVVEDSEPYIFRASGGSADIGNREEDTIVGGSIAWNQILPTARKSASVTPDGSTTYSSYNTGNYLTVGHKYLVSVNITYNGSKTLRAYVQSGSNYGLSAQNVAKSNAWVLLANGTNCAVGISNVTTSDKLDSSDAWSYDNGMAIDLTQMFGTAVADAVYAMEQANAGSGVAWFKAMYPLDYYEYNTGELKSVEGLTSHDMVGFNAWDEEWEVGNINGNNGNPISDSTRIRSKNFSMCLPSTAYYKGSVNIFWYDADKNYISFNTASASNPVTSPSNARYFKVSTGANYGTTYKNDICINLSWSGTRNGEYEPYVKHSYPLDSTLTLRGIPKWGTDGMYYDGDTYEADGTVTRKYGVVDLGTLEWTSYSSTLNRCNANLADLKQVALTTDIGNVITTKLTTISVGNFDADTSKDMTIAVNNGSPYIWARIRSATSAQDYKTALSGVMLVYELATPTTETADPFTTPQIVDDFGTEEYVTTGLTAVGHTTKYPSNLRDKLQHLPDLASTDGAYLIQQTGTQMTLVNFRIPKAENLADGTYVLKATVSGGTPTYTWEAEQ